METDEHKEIEEDRMMVWIRVVVFSAHANLLESLPRRNKRKRKKEEADCWTGLAGFLI